MMENEWQLQDAKNKFSEVVNQAINQGPQLITRRGEKTAVLLSFADYEKICKAQGKLSDFFRTSPLAEVSLSRENGNPREGSKS
jgi:antitoxin Phd